MERSAQAISLAAMACETFIPAYATEDGQTHEFHVTVYRFDGTLAIESTADIAAAVQAAAILVNDSNSAADVAIKHVVTEPNGTTQFSVLYAIDDLAPGMDWIDATLRLSRIRG